MGQHYVKRFIKELRRQAKIGDESDTGIRMLVLDYEKKHMRNGAAISKCRSPILKGLEGYLA